MLLYMIYLDICDNRQGACVSSLRCKKEYWGVMAVLLFVAMFLNMGARRAAEISLGDQPMTDVLGMRTQ